MATGTIVHSALWEQLKNTFFSFSFDVFVSDGISSIARNALAYHTNGDHAKECITGRACVTYRTEDKYVLVIVENNWKEILQLRGPRRC